MKQIFFGSLTVVLLTHCAHATRTAHDAPKGTPALRVVTFNVNFGLGGDEATLDALAAPDGDLLVLQETTPAWEAAARKKLGAKWPYQTWLHARAAGGLAVLSKRPFEVKRVLDNPAGWFPALHVVAQTPLGPVQVLAVHLRPPVSDDGSFVKGYLSTGPARRDEVRAFLPALDGKLPTLVAGDFNESASGDAVRYLEANGLRTALPEFEPGAKTWRWKVSGLYLSAQLDHVAYDARLEPVAARVERAGNSDHFPVVVDLVRATDATMRGPAPSGSSLSVSLYER